MRPAARALIGLWAVVLLAAGGGAVVLQLLGPPKPAMPGPAATRVGRPPGTAASAARPKAPAAAAAPIPASGAEVAAATGVAPPDPALLEPAAGYPDRMLPRIGADGRTPARAYVSHAGLPAHGPQVAILLEGFGLHELYSRDAIEQLPAAISFAVSPYAGSLEHAGPDPLLDAARQAGHEAWLSLPMEPAGSPYDDEGAQALRTGIDYDQDRHLLAWSLSRLQGYVGVTNALSGLRGDRFADSSGFGIVTAELGARGLLYVDAGTAPHAETGVKLPPDSRHADLIIDEVVDATDIEARLSRLEEIAQLRGSALGVAGPLRPVTIERLHAWSQHLALRGITLVPVSALPAQRPTTATPAEGSAPVPVAPPALSPSGASPDAGPAPSPKPPAVASAAMPEPSAAPPATPASRPSPTPAQPAGSTAASPK